MREDPHAEWVRYEDHRVIVQAWYLIGLILGAGMGWVAAFVVLYGARQIL